MSIISCFVDWYNVCVELLRSFFALCVVSSLACLLVFGSDLCLRGSDLKRVAHREASNANCRTEDTDYEAHDKNLGFYRMCTCVIGVRCKEGRYD
jgi:hypothetical protein